MKGVWGRSKRQGARATCHRSPGLRYPADHADIGLQDADGRSLGIDPELLGRSEIGAQTDHDPGKLRRLEQGFRRPYRIFQPQQIERLPARRGCLDVRQGVRIVAVGDKRHLRADDLSRRFDDIEVELVNLDCGDLGGQRLLDTRRDLGRVVVAIEAGHHRHAGPLRTSQQGGERAPGGLARNIPKRHVDRGQGVEIGARSGRTRPGEAGLRRSGAPFAPPICPGRAARWRRVWSRRGSAAGPAEGTGTRHIRPARTGPSLCTGPGTARRPASRRRPSIWEAAGR